jgi:TolB-like protein/tetratricopeptide (TPR) repeat protein/succinate dehydrogenase/fumarate reductase cytochrome b subunit
VTEGAEERGGPATGAKPGEAPVPASPRKATFSELLTEMKHRRVFRVMVGYGIFTFAVLQVIEPIMHGAHLPDWVLTATLIALVVGFAVALLLAWLFDLTAQGVRRAPWAVGSGGIYFSRRRLAELLVAVALVSALPVLAWHMWKQAGQPEARAAGADATPSIAVLPFADMSPQKDQEYFSDGVSEEILNALAHLDGLRVIGRTSSFSFKGKSDDLRDISAKLGVRNVLEGSVRRQGDRVRVTAQLVRAEDGSHVWSETYDRDLKDIFAVQGEIALAVVDALRVKLLSTSGVARGVITVNREAYDQYLHGLALSRSAEVDSHKRALAAFEKAVALDGAFALAWAHLSGAIGYLEANAGEGVHPEQRRRALDAAERAIALAPELPDGYDSRADFRILFLQDWEGARADAERARVLGPNDAGATIEYGFALTALGKVQETIAVMKQATEIDPLSFYAWCFLGSALTSADEHERARAAFARALEITPHSDLAEYYLIWDLAASNQPHEVLAQAEKATVGWVRFTGLAIAQHDLGNTRESQEALEALIKGNSQDGPFQIAEVYAWRGEYDQAFAWLERARVQADSGLFQVKIDPLFRKIRGDPRYGAFLRKIHMPVD